MANQRSYFPISGTIFLLVAFAHLTRLVGGWGVTIAGRAVPQWISIPGLMVPAALSAWGLLLASRAHRAGAVS